MDAYEIQVYDGTANEPGAAGAELHANRDTRARESHYTLEPSYGIARNWELGCYLQSAVLEDGTYAWSGAKLRSKHVWRISEAVRVGANLEISLVPKRVEPDRWGGELRPIVAWENAWLAVAANPIVGFGGDGPTFEPAVSAKVKIAGAIAVGPEYYADFGPIASLHGWHEQEHYVFEVIDLLAVHRLELQFGLGEGVSPASHPLVGKMIAGITF